MTLAPVNLHFEDSGEWYSLPEWAEYFISVGKHLASEDNSASRIVTAIVVPTRAYCAAFVSLGMIVSDAAAHDSSSAAAHFEMLFDLPIGTPVILRQSPRKALRGVLQEKWLSLFEQIRLIFRWNLRHSYIAIFTWGICS
ncbi:hypothetical protein SAMN05421830_105236, partial [Desulfomicrobium norvegicum]